MAHSWHTWGQKITAHGNILQQLEVYIRPDSIVVEGGRVLSLVVWKTTVNHPVASSSLARGAI